MKRNKLLAILTSAVMASAFAVPAEVRAVDASQLNLDFESGCLTNYMVISSDDVRSVSDEVKTVYEETLAALEGESFDYNFYVDFSDDFEAGLPCYTDPVAARKTVGETLKIADNIYWGIITPAYAENADPSIYVYLHPDEVDYLAGVYDMDTNEFAARTAVWLSLCPYVESFTVQTVDPDPTGWYPEVILEAYGLEYILEQDTKGIFANLPTYMPLCYVDGLEQLQQFEGDKYTDAWRYSLNFYAEAPAECFTDDVYTDQTPFLDQLYITEDWLTEEGIVQKYYSIYMQEYHLSFDKDFIDGYISAGYEDAHIFASLYAWFEANDCVDRIEVEADTEADLYKEYTFVQFFSLSEEEVIAIHQELAPDIDAAAECETIKAAAEAGIANEALNLLVDVTMDFHVNAVWLGEDDPYSLFSVNGYPMFNGMCATYITSEYDSEDCMEYRIKLKKYGSDPALAAYKLSVWVLAQAEVKAVRVEDTTFISCGLTEEELYEKYTFDDIMKLSPEEICTFSERIKKIYTNLSPAIDYLGFTNNIEVSFTEDYTRYLYENEDFIAARREVGEKLRLPDEVYWGMNPSYTTYDNTAYYSTAIYLHHEDLEAIAQSYGLTKGDFAARLIVWMDLNPEASYSYGGFHQEGTVGAINPYILYQEEHFSFDAIAEGTPKEIYGLPFYSALYYVDALIYARDNELEAAEDFYKQRFNVQISKNKDCFNDDGTVNHDELIEMLHIDASWLRGGTTDGSVYDDETDQYYKWMNLDIDEGFYDRYIDSGCEYDSVFAAVYTWLISNNHLGAVTVESNGSYTPPAVTHGEVNRDGKVSLLDVVSLSKYNAGIVTYNQSQLRAADCTGDGIVNGSDLTALLMFMVNLIDSLPVEVK